MATTLNAPGWCSTPPVLWVKSPALHRSWAEALCGYSLKHGYDHERGGFFYTGPLGKPATDQRKEWWVEAEALVAMLELYQLTGKQEYYTTFSQTLDFIEKYQVAPQGSWWATRSADGSPQGTTRTSPWQGAYHNGRAMILCAKRLDQLAQQVPPAGRDLGDVKPGVKLRRRSKPGCHAHGTP